MSTKPYAVTVEPAPLEQEDIRRAAEEMDRALRRHFGAPHMVENVGTAYAWSKLIAALWPAGSRVRS